MTRATRRTGWAARKVPSWRAAFGSPTTLIMIGRHDDARRLFERLLGLTNDVGLLAEQYDAKAGRMLGNFPQAFSHVALINPALNLSRQQSRSRSARARAPSWRPREALDDRVPGAHCRTEGRASGSFNCNRCCTPSASTMSSPVH